MTVDVQLDEAAGQSVPPGFSVILEAEAACSRCIRRGTRFPDGRRHDVVAFRAMVLSACKAGDEIILPRNVHRSVINALVLCRCRVRSTSTRR